MTAPMIAFPADQALSAFLDGPVLFHHTLSEHPLFQDEGLAALIDGQPDSMLDLNINTFNAEGQLEKIMNGDRAGLSGAQLLQAVGRGALWMNLRHVNDTSPAVAEVMRDLQAALVAQNPRFKNAHLDANLLISAPGAKVAYHAEQPEVMLCHIRGAKRIWVYPNGGQYLPDEHFEKVVLRETTEDIHYERAYDAQARVFDLAPGQALTWPPNAPHRVENLGTVNVSLSIEYMTWDSRIRLGAFYVNGLLRRNGVTPPPVAALGPVGLAARWALSVPLKRMGLHKAKQVVFEPAFEVDPTAEGNVRQRA